MSDTNQADVPPQTNGISELDDDERAKLRPVDIDADVREMERRKRVELIMNSKLFREELERIIETQLKDGSGANGLLQQISDMVGVNKQAGNVFKSSSCVIPINDIRGIEAMGYAKGEKILRCKLASLYRLIDLYGWAHGSNTLITARLNQDEEQFLVNPYGMLFHEITASSLIKTGMQGNVLEQGTTNFPVNITAFSLHGAVHSARPDIKCIIHIHTPSVVAVSALKQGLLPLTQESVVIGEVSVHTYLGGWLDPEEKDKLARNLGPNNKILLLSNQGALCCGETIEEAFFNARNTVLASESQLKLLPVGMDNLVLINDEIRKKIYDAAHNAPESTPRPDQPMILEGKVERKWRVGGTEFESLMRLLDNAGFRTGYIYRHPLVKGEPPKPKNDVEVPPAVSSLGYLLEEEELYRQGLWRKLEGGKKGHDRSRWLNSPNTYQKVEILETGTPDPKKITKWVAEGSPSHSSTPVKIDSALQFVPKGTNPKEFKQKQQQIKDYRRADKISAGPQSHILEGVTWEEARKMQDATITQTGDQVVLMGAASKGIIQRGHQHNAMVYKSPYAKNPFDSVTDEELDEYKKVVEKKTKGDYDTDFSESEGLSSAALSKRIDGINITSPTSVTSETEEESRDEPQILRIETKTAPRPSQPEVVLSDVESSPLENFIQAEIASATNHRGIMTRSHSNYRTHSHAGFPQGSFLIPNPVHYHVACDKRIVLRRPQLISYASRHASPKNPHANKIIINLDDPHSVSLKIPVQNLAAFIDSFGDVCFANNQSSQTTYMGNSEYTMSDSQELNLVTYTPVFVDSYSTCQTEEESPEKSKTFEKRVLENLRREIESEQYSSESDVSTSLDVSQNSDCETNFTFDGETVTDNVNVDVENCARAWKTSTSSSGEIVIRLSNIIKEYVKRQYLEIRELVLFPEKLRDANKIRLMNELTSTYRLYFRQLLSQEEQFNFKTSLTAYVMSQLETDLNLNQSDKLFDVPELINGILERFMSLVHSNKPVRVLKERNISPVTPNDQNLTVNEELTTFRKRFNSELGLESYWLAFVSKKRTPGSPSDSHFDSTGKKPKTVRLNLFDTSNVFHHDSDEDGPENLGCVKSSVDDRGTSELVVASRENKIFPFDVNTKRLERKVLRNSVNFYRTKTSNTFVQTKSNTIRSSISENKENMEENVGNWMGYEFAKF